VAGVLIGPGASRLDELEAETGRRFFFDTRDDLPASHFAVTDRGPVSRLEGKALPVAKGDELDVKLEDIHLQSPGDAVARVNGYVIAVAGAKNRIGQTVRVKIERATRTVAYATLTGVDGAGEAPIEAGTELDREDAGVTMTPRRSRGSRGGRGRGKKPAEGAATEAKPAAEPEKPKRSRAAKPKPTPKPEEPQAATATPAEGESTDETPKPKKKTRRGSRGGRGRKKKPTTATAESTNGAEAAVEPVAAAAPVEPAPAEPAAERPEKPETNGAEPEVKPRKKTRRGSRGGRNRRKKPAVVTDGDTPTETPAELPLAPVAPDEERG
jgi:predicted RNA-binding protein with TRAM domain